ncbi:MAG TPA: hypothetical protein VNO14_04880 [Blastocatellia bacterium]|nr:hypothetical protein [Blastocatellia bacterium]
MRGPTHSAMAAVWLLFYSLAVPIGVAQSSAGTIRFIRAFVVDDRLSALRREPDLRSRVVQRLRIGREVFIYGLRSGKGGQPDFYRVALSRRTRGWIHRSAVAVPNRSGEDERVLRLAEEAENGFDRIVLCRLLSDHFKRSPLAALSLLRLAEEAERAAASLSARARRRLSGIDKDGLNARDYYLSDAGLDRYSRLGVGFDFDEAAARYVYDGQAYRDIIRRYPRTPEARIARARLEARAGRPGQ